MKLWDKIAGTKSGDAGVAPVSLDELRTALLQLTGDDAPWHVRDGQDLKCDLVAEWRIVDAEWHSFLSENGLHKMFRVKMKLDESTHQVHNIDQSASISWDGPIPSVSRAWSTGQLDEKDTGAGFQVQSGGALGKVYSYSFNSADIKDPLRDAVTSHGWGWKADMFKF